MEEVIVFEMEIFAVSKLIILGTLELSWIVFVLWFRGLSKFGVVVSWSFCRCGQFWTFDQQGGSLVEEEAFVLRLLF